MMSDDEEQYDSKAHKSLLNSVNSLNQIQHIRKSSRNEPKQQQNEFQLGKASTSSLNDTFHRSVGTNDIVKLLKTTKKYADIGKKIKNVQSTKKVLQKPLEKPATDRIKRIIGYDIAKKQLGRWDAAVAKMRSAESQVFPLQSDTIYINTSVKNKLKPSLKSDLANGLAKTDEKLKTLKNVHADDSREAEQLTKKLSKDEIIARRKELAYLKMRESQKSAKARLQNKIKSKKYHKLMKRQRMLEQIKEFEILKKSNPDAALEKLNALERSRVIERASLRHKNTGVWAKNLQMRAKYDSSVRKDLAEQLARSRQLTEHKTEASENDENADQTIDNSFKEQNCEYDPFNPWTKSETTTNSKTDATAEGDSPQWRSYWITRNKNEKLLAKHHAEQITEEADSNLDEKHETKKKPINNNSLKERLKKPKHTTSENGWHVEEVADIDDIFSNKEEQITDQVGRKLLKLSRKAKSLKRAHLSRPKKNKREKDELKNLKDLSFMQTAKVPDLDEALNTFDENQNPTNTFSATDKPVSVDKSVDSSHEKKHLNPDNVDTIDASKLATVKLKQHIDLSNDFGENLSETDLVQNTEFDEAKEKKLTISHAFEDDDIFVDFSMDKTEQSEAKNAEIQLSMPGWGSWAGSGIVHKSENSKHKFNRLNLKLEPEKRRDENKEGVYINEDTNKLLRTHLVSSVPFPFTSVKDFEANNRAPIGRNMVTETAFRKLTRPAVITRKGRVIEPMNESDLMQPEKRPRRVAHKRNSETDFEGASKFKKELMRH